MNSKHYSPEFVAFKPSKVRPLHPLYRVISGVLVFLLSFAGPAPFVMATDFAAEGVYLQTMNALGQGSYTGGTLQIFASTASTVSIGSFGLTANSNSAKNPSIGNLIFGQSLSFNGSPTSPDPGSGTTIDLSRLTLLKLGVLGGNNPTLGLTLNNGMGFGVNGFGDPLAPTNGVELLSSQLWTVNSGSYSGSKIGDIGTGGLRVTKSTASGAASTMNLSLYVQGGSLASSVALDLGSDINLTTSGSGDIALLGSTSYSTHFTGALTINGGTIHLQDGALVTYADANNNVVAPTISINPTTSNLLLSGKNTISQITALGGSGTPITIKGDPIGNSTVLVFAPVGSGSLTFSGLLKDDDDGQNPLSVSKTGALSTLELSGQSTFSGDGNAGFTLNGGTLVVTSSSVLSGSLSSSLIASGPVGTGALKMNPSTTISTGAATVTLHNPLTLDTTDGLSGEILASGVNTYFFLGNLTLGSAISYVGDTSATKVDFNVANGSVLSLSPTGSTSIFSGTDLIKDGTGTLVFGGSAAFDGDNLWVKEGTLVLKGGTIGSFNNIAGLKTLAFGSSTSSGTVRFDQSWSGFNEINTPKSLAILPGAQAFLVPDTAWSGSINFGDGSKVRLQTSGTMSVGAGLSVSVGTIAAGTFGAFADTNITVDPGSWTASGTSGATATFTKAGQGNLSVTQAPSAISSISVSAGTFTYNAASSNLSAAPNVVLSSATSTLGLNSSSTTRVDVTGVVSGAGAVVVDTLDGNGVAGLSGANSYTGGTTIKSGVLEANSATALGSSGAITFAGGTLRYGAAAAAANDVSSRFTATGSSLYQIDTNSDDATFASVLAGSTTGLAKYGAGKLTLSGANTFGGMTSLYGGTLVIGNALALQNSTLNYSAGSVAFGTTSATFAGLIGSLPLSLTNTSSAAVALTVNTTGTNSVYSGVISGLGGITKSGVGTLTLSGINTYSGDTILSAGTLVVANQNTLATSTVQTTAGSSLNFGTLTAVNLAGLKGAGNVSLTSGSSTAVTLSLGTFGSTTTYSGVLSGSGSLVKTGSGVLSLTGNNTYSGTTTVAAGTLSLGDGTSNGSVTGSITGAGAAALIFNNATAQTYAGNVSGLGSFEKKGAGTLTLTGTESANNTFISGGTLALAGNGTVGTAITLSNNAKMIFGSTGYRYTGQQITGAGSVDVTGPGTMIFTSLIGYTGNTTIGSGSTLQLGGDTFSFSDLSFSGPIANSGNLIFDNGANAYAYSGILSQSGAIEKRGTGALTLTGVSTNTGTLTVTAGPVTVSGTGALGGSLVNNNGSSVLVSNLGSIGGSVFNNNGTVTVSGTGVVRGNLTNTVGTTTLSGSGSVTGNVSNAGTVSISGNGLIGGNISNTGALNYDVASGVTKTFSGAFSGAGGTFTKSGAGTLQLFGANTFTAATSVTGGTLAFNSLPATPSILLTNNAILKLSLSGDGTLNAPINGSTGTTFLSSNAPVTLTLGASIEGNVQLGSNVTLSLASGVKILGDITIASGAKLDVRNAGNNAFGGTSTLTINTGGMIEIGTTQQEIQNVLMNGGTASGSNGGIIYFGSLSPSNSTMVGGGTFQINTKTETFTNGIRLLAGRLGNLAGAGSYQFIELKAEKANATLRIDQAAFATESVIAGGTAGAFNVSVDGAVTTNLFDVQSGVTASFTTNGSLIGGTLQVEGNVDFAGGSKTLSSLKLLGGSLGAGTLSAGVINATSGTIAMSLASGAINKTSTGVLNLATAASSGYSGVITIADGKVVLGNATALGAKANVNFLTAGVGILQVNGNNVAFNAVGGPTGAGTIENGATTGGTATFDLGSDTLFSGTLRNGASGALSVTKKGTNSLALSGPLSYTGTTTLEAGGLTLNSNLTGGGALTVMDGVLNLGGLTHTLSQVTVSGGTVSTGGLSSAAYAVQGGIINATLGGTGALTKTGAGTTTLNAVNTYSGGTTVTQGNLVLGNGGALGTTGAITVNGGLLDLGGNNQTVAVTTLSGGSINNGTLNATTYSVQSGVVGAKLTGGSLTKTTTGTVTLNALNTYSGLTSVNEGRLVLAASTDALPTGGDITVGAGVGGGILDLGGNTHAAGVTTLVSGSIVSGTLNATSYAVQSGAISANLTGGALNKTTTGAVVLSGANTYNGTTVTDGKLTLANGASLLSTGAITVNGGSLDLGGNNQSSGILTLAGGAVINGSLNASTFDARNGSISARLIGSGSLTKTTSGTVTLNGANTYTGGTTIQAGQLVLASGASLFNTGLISVSGGLLDLGGNTQSAGATTLTGGSVGNGNLNATSYNLQAGTIGAVLSGGAVTKSTTGTVVLNNANTYSGGTNLSDGVLVMGNANALSTGTLNFTGGALSFGTLTSANIGALQGAGSISLANGNAQAVTLNVGSNNGNTTYAGTLSGAGALVKTGSGAMTFSNASAFSAYTGATTISGGSLIGTDLLSGSRTISNSGALYLTLSGSQTFTGQLTGTGSTFLDASSDVVLTLGVGAKLDGSITLGNHIILDVGSSGNKFGESVSLTLNTGSKLQLNATEQEISTLVSNGGIVAGTAGSKVLYNNFPNTVINSDSSPTAVVSGSVAFEVLTKTQTIPNGIRLVAGRLGTLASAGTAQFIELAAQTAGTTLRIDKDATATTSVVAAGTNGNFSVSVDALVTTPLFSIGNGVAATLTQGGTITGAIANAGTLLISVTGADKTIANTISGSGGLTKIDSGVATLSGNNTYTGKTTLAGGVLAATGASSFGSGNIVFNGGTLRYANAPTQDFSARFDAVSTGITATVDTNGNDVTYATGLSGAGGVAKSGAGVLVLTGSNTFAGPLSVTAGTVQVGAGGTSGSIAASAVVGVGTTLRFNRANDVTYSGAITGLGAVAQSGAANLTLGASNSFSGGLSLNSGTVLLAASGAGGVGTITFNGGVLKYGAADASTDYSSRFISGNQKAFNIDTNGQTVTANTAFIGLNGVLNKMGLGTLRLTANNTQVNSMNVSAGTLELMGNQSGQSTTAVSGGAALKVTLGDGNTAAGLVSLAQNANATFTVGSGTATFGGTLSGAGSFSKEGAGNLRLSASQTNTGGVSVNGGILTLGTGVKLGGTITLNTGSTLDAVYGVLDASNNLAFQGGTLILGSSGQLNVVDFGTGGAATSSTGEELTVIVKDLIGSGTAVVSPHVTFLKQVTLSSGKSAISGALKGTFTNLDVSELSLTSANGALVTLAGSNGIKLDKLDAGAGVNLAITKSLEATGNVSLTAGSLTLQDSLTSTGGTVTFSGGEQVTISGSGSIVAPRLTLVGGSTITLDALGAGALGGVKTLTIGTSSADSTLVVNGGSGTYTIGQNQTLEGKGTIRGNVTLANSTSTLNAGNSPGKLYVSGTLNLVSGTVVMEVGQAGQDQIDATGGVIMGNGTLYPSLKIVDYDGTLASGGTLQALFVSGTSTIRPDYMLNGGSLLVGGTTQLGGFITTTFARRSSTGATVDSAMYSLDQALLTAGTIQVNRTRFASLGGLSGNLSAFARALDTRVITQTASTDGLLEIGTGVGSSVLDSGTLRGVTLQLAAVNPAGYAELANLGFRRLTDLHLGVVDRLQSLRSGPVPMSSNGFAAWMTGYGSSQKLDGDSSKGTAGYSSSNFGDLMGVEKHIGDLVLGVTAAAGRTSANFSLTSGKVTTDSLHAGFFASAPVGALFLDSAFMIGTTDSTVTRNISATGLTTRSGRAKVTGMEWLWQAGGALPMNNGSGLTLTPSLRLIAQGYTQDAATESDMAGLEVKTGKQSATSLMHQTGLELTKKLKFADRPATFGLNLDWIHSYDSKGRSLDLQLSGNSGATFTSQGTNAGGDAIRISGAFDLAMSDRTTLRLGLEQQIQSKVSTTRGSISVGISF